MGFTVSLVQRQHGCSLHPAIAKPGKISRIHLDLEKLPSAAPLLPI